MRKYFLAPLFISFFSVIAFSQDPYVSLKVKVGGEKIIFNDSTDIDTVLVKKGFLVKVFIGDSLVTQDTTDSAGRVPDINLAIGFIYTVKMEGAGYVTKTVEINTNYPLEKRSDLVPVLYQQIEVSLFEVQAGCDFSFLETTPMVKFYIDERAGFLEFDRIYTKGILVQLEEIRSGKKDE